MEGPLLLALLVAAALGAAADAVDLQMEEWVAFKLEHRKSYASAAEERAHMAQFARHRLAVARHNQRHALRLEPYRLALNRFADMTTDEFARAMNGFRPPKRRLNVLRSAGTEPRGCPHQRVADQVDWRKTGAVTRVKDQGHCASCWAFAATGALEGQLFLHKRFLVSLSEQRLVDCMNNTQPCTKGNVDEAFWYVHGAGIASEKTYPYKAKQEQCRYPNRNVIPPQYVRSITDWPLEDEECLKLVVATQGPVAAAIDASHQSFQLYESGVYYDEACSSCDVNHAVLVVGYGTDEALGDYWLVKNSYGEGWGECGYVRMARGRRNNCGIATYTSLPVMDAGRPRPTVVQL
ncbi:cathepsin L-like [Maniola hyperantus]|uniref:cathepsin L-like n=1 Tax=Aphantopus hyperantus TaxID=2795564 RepID=UPI003749B1DF